MRATIYCRISSDREGAGLGVQAQEHDCRELAASIGASIVSVHTDNDLSAYSGKPRPGYKTLLDEIAAGKVDTVIVWHTDRLHRSPSELEEYITACEPNKVTTNTVKAGQLDLSTPTGLVMARTLGAFARYEVDHARERMQRAKKRSADSGRWKGGRRPFGFEDDGVTIRESEAELIRSATDDILAGGTVGGLARAWNAAGSRTPGSKAKPGGPWPQHGPRRILLRPRNAGLMEHQGEVVGEAEWPAIVDPEKWRAVVGVLTSPHRRTNHGTNAGKWLGSGRYLCGVCGSSVRASKANDGKAVYRCRAVNHLTRGREDVDHFVESVIVMRLRREDAADLLRPSRPEFDVGAAEKRAVELRERLNQLAHLFAEGSIDAEQLAGATKALNADLTAVRETIAAAYTGTVFDGIATSPDPGAAWLDAPLDRKRAVLNALVTVRLLPSKKGRPAGWTPGSSYFRPETVEIGWRS